MQKTTPRFRDVALVFNIFNYALNSAFTNSAKIIKCNGAYGLVVLQSVKQAAAQSVRVYQLVRCDTLLLYGFVKRSVRYHKSALLYN